MSFSYPLASLVSKLNFASKRKLFLIYVPFTNFNLSVLKVLYTEGVINAFVIRKSNIVVYLKYLNNKSVFKSLKVVSRPGKRKFSNLVALQRYQASMYLSGFYIISTSKGILSSSQSLFMFENVGELLIKVDL